MSIREIRAILTILCAAIFISGCGSEEEPGLRKGVAAPDFQIELLSGETVKLSDYKGKVVLLNFWATWCSPCVGEMPDIQRIADDYTDEVVVLGINCGEDLETVKYFLDSNGYTYNIGLDEKMELNKKYPTEGIPYTLIINGKGIISSTHLGAPEDAYSVFENDIKTALGVK